MRLAYLILGHKDPEHIGRLSKKLSNYSDVYIHIDSSVDEIPFRKVVGSLDNVFFIQRRFRCWWGGYNVIQAEIELLACAMQAQFYDRIVLLQGSDYPLKSGKEILSFFELNKNVEFIHCTSCSRSKDPYLYRRCCCYWFYDNPNLLKRVWNKLNFLFSIPLRSKVIHEGNRILEIYWGCAQWAITGECAKYIIEFYLSHEKVNKWFKHAFPVDELYINTIVMNSKFSRNTFYKNQKTIKSLVNLRNLHYFEYPSMVKVFTAEDYKMLCGLDELYCRKVNTNESSDLLDMIDAAHNSVE
ncbi:MAG: beta-1,6-N-acetylglucosaminyltransferase [Lachnospiraceae bacterium]|nr:beta-1,6-N-acetylglucosaminyltransferase [Lachnospiraceae bacterium]